MGARERIRRNGCGLERKAKAVGGGWAVAAEGLVGFGLLRGVLPLETHTDSGGLLAAPPPSV